MQVWASPTGRTAAVTPEGELDIASAVSLRRALARAVELPGVRLVVVDLQRTPFVDSTVLGVLVGAGRRGGRRGVPVVLTHPQRRVARTIALTGLDHLLTGEERRRLSAVV
jgi:anti-sigma B factor antagonist